jgi:hypothetical protein
VVGAGDVGKASAGVACDSHTVPSAAAGIDYSRVEGRQDALRTTVTQNLICAPWVAIFVRMLHFRHSLPQNPGCRLRRRLRPLPGWLSSDPALLTGLSGGVTIPSETANKLHNGLVPKQYRCSAVGERGVRGVFARFGGSGVLDCGSRPGGKSACAAGRGGGGYWEYDDLINFTIQVLHPPAQASQGRTPPASPFPAAARPAHPVKAHFPPSPLPPPRRPLSLNPQLLGRPSARDI